MKIPIKEIGKGLVKIGKNIKSEDIVRITKHTSEVIKHVAEAATAIVATILLIKGAKNKNNNKEDNNTKDKNNS